MIDGFYDIFINKLYFIEAMLGILSVDVSKVFNSLCKVFCYGEAEAKALFECVENEEVKSITSISEYNRLMRIIEYKKLCGSPSTVSTDTKRLLEQKYIGIKKAETVANILRGAGNPVCMDSLNEVSVKYYTEVLFLQALMHCEGLNVTKNIQKGITFAKKAMEWNDPAAALLLIEYDANQAIYYRQILYSILVCENRVISEENTKRYSLRGSCKEYINRARLINKFREHCEQPYVYNQTAVSVAASGLFCNADKELILSSGSINSVGVQGLALCDKYEKICVLRQTKTVISALREQESHMIKMQLDGYLCNQMFLPVGVVCDSEYLCERIIQTITHWINGEPITLSAETLNLGLYQPGVENCFLSALISAQRQNALFIIRNAERLSDSSLSVLGGMLKIGSPKNILLNDCGVHANISDSKFVFIFSKPVDERAFPFLSLFKLASCTIEENEADVMRLFDLYSKDMGIKAVLSEGAQQKLAKMPEEARNRAVVSVLLSASVCESKEIMPKDIDMLQAKTQSVRF